MTSELTGDLYVGDEKYTFSLLEIGKSPNKYLFGTASQGEKEVFYIYMYDNLETIF